MEVKLQKRKHSGLKKLIKVDENNNVIEGQQELYVRLEEVEDNLLNSDATPLSEEVLKNINWKDEEALLFKETTVLPDPISGVSQIVSLDNGEIWCVPGCGKEAFKLGADDIVLYLKKNFQEYENLTLLGSNTIIGALPTSFSLDGDSNASTYLDFKDGAINFKINGQTKHSLKTDGVSFTQGNAELCLSDSEISLKNHSAGTTIGLMNDSFYIKGNNTQISEDLSLNKLNFFTNLEKAVYGNATIYLEFYSDQVRFKSSSGSNLLTIKTDGTIYSGSNPYTYIVNSNNVNSYIKPYLDSNFESYFDTQFNSKYETAWDTQFNSKHPSAFDTQFNSKFYDKFNYYLSQEFESRLDEYFKNKFYEHYTEACSNSTTIFTGSTTSYEYCVSSYTYKINFSDTSTGSIMSISFDGDDIDSLSPIYKKETGNYYLVSQNYASDDSESDYITVYKCNSSGSYLGTVYIRGIYRY